MRGSFLIFQEFWELSFLIHKILGNSLGKRVLSFYTLAHKFCFLFLSFFVGEWFMGFLLLFVCFFIAQFSLQAAVLDDPLEGLRNKFTGSKTLRARGDEDPRLQLLCSHIPQLFHETDRSVNELIDAYATLSLSQLWAIADHASTLFRPGYDNSTRVKIVGAASVLLPHEIRARTEAFATHHDFLRAACSDQESHAYVTSLALTLTAQQLDERARLMKLYLNWLYPDDIYPGSSVLVSIVALDTPAQWLRESFGPIIRHSSSLFHDNLNPNSRAIAILNLLQIRPESISLIAGVLERYEGFVSSHDAYWVLYGLAEGSLRSL